MKKVKIYTIGKAELIAEVNVKNVYEDSFYHRNMPTLSARRCKQILNDIYPHFKADGITLVFEYVDSGFTWTQQLHRNGTILVG